MLKQYKITFITATSSTRKVHRIPHPVMPTTSWGPTHNSIIRDFLQLLLMFLPDLTARFLIKFIYTFRLIKPTRILYIINVHDNMC